MQNPAAGCLPHFGAFESTRIHGSGTDVLETTRHIERWRDDLTLLRSSGLTDLRYSIPWHRIEPTPGQFDFEWIDGPMECMRREGMRPIVDLLHHTSFPDWLQNGFENPQFPDLYARFVRRFIERYEWVDRATAFNEPLATTLMCSVIGAWYPYRKSDRAFATMSVHVARAICMAEEILRASDANFISVYIDTCEHHQPLDSRSVTWVDFANRRRYCLLDMVLGQMNRHHPLFEYLRGNGAREDDLAWLRDHPSKPDILGLDYYPHSEMDWFWNAKRRMADIACPVRRPRGFADVAMDYVDRYCIPVMLAETNVRGTISDRITWLRFMEEQTHHLIGRGADVRGFCWYPSIDSTDWCHLCARCTKSVDPQGIWYLDEREGRWTRFQSELSELYSKLARGGAVYSDLPAYTFLPPLNVDLAGYLKLMSHWDDWIELSGVERAA